MSIDGMASGSRFHTSFNDSGGGNMFPGRGLGQVGLSLGTKVRVGGCLSVSKGVSLSHAGTRSHPCFNACKTVTRLVNVPGGVHLSSLGRCSASNGTRMG